MKKIYEQLELRHLLLKIQGIDDLELKASLPFLEEKFYMLYVSSFGKKQLPLKFYYSALDIPDAQTFPDAQYMNYGDIFRCETLARRKNHGKFGVNSADINWFDNPDYRFFVALRQLMSRERSYLKLYLPPASCGLDTPLMKIIRRMNLA